MTTPIQTFNGKDAEVRIYIDDTNPGAAPSDWTTPDMLAVATSASITVSKELNDIRGIGNQNPQAVKEGGISHEFSMEAIYTTDTYSSTDILDLIKAGQQFAVLLAVKDDSGNYEQSQEVTYARAGNCEWSFSEDSDITANISGRGVSSGTDVVS